MKTEELKQKIDNLYEEYAKVTVWNTQLLGATLEIGKIIIDGEIQEMTNLMRYLVAKSTLGTFVASELVKVIEVITEGDQTVQEPSDQNNRLDEQNGHKQR